MALVKKQWAAKDFYPRPPGGGRRPRRVRPRLSRCRFLSTPSGWRATGAFAMQEEGEKMISIHALRVEGDFESGENRDIPKEFLSTPSGWRATEGSENEQIEYLKFLSTPSGWRATVFSQRLFARRGISIHALRVEGDRYTADAGRRLRISIHALRVEGDSRRKSRTWTTSYFYPRPPGGGRPHRQSLHPSRARHFYPRPPGGGRR